MSDTGNADLEKRLAALEQGKGAGSPPAPRRSPLLALVVVLVIGAGGALLYLMSQPEEEEALPTATPDVFQNEGDGFGAIETLRSHGALAWTTVVVAEATASAGIKYLAPFAGCAIAEDWMHAGHDTLIVYDDLTTHARAYRELSLLLRRPPGREAYPADIFYLHARLLERSTRLAVAGGGGSMTALPIAETEQGEIAAYIPTNLISITDGQIHFDTALFARGVLPAIDITRSVARIGGKAQHEAIKREAGRMKLDYLQFLELEVFTRFGAKLEASMEARIRRGRLLREILGQDRLDPHSPADQLAWLIACNENLLDGLAGDALAVALRHLREGATTTTLTLDSPRDQWLSSVQHWLAACQTPTETLAAS